MTKFVKEKLSAAPIMLPTEDFNFVQEKQIIKKRAYRKSEPLDEIDKTIRAIIRMGEMSQKVPELEAKIKKIEKESNKKIKELEAILREKETTIITQQKHVEEMNKLNNTLKALNKGALVTYGE